MKKLFLSICAGLIVFASVAAPKQSLKVRLFFKGLDTEEEKGASSEYRNFQQEESATFCGNSETFYKLMLEGKIKNGTVVIKDQNGLVVFKKEKLKFPEKRWFTEEDFTLNTEDQYTLIVQEGDDVLFEGKISAKDCE